MTLRRLLRPAGITLVCAGLCFVASTTQADQPTSPDAVWRFLDPEAEPPTGAQAWWMPKKHRPVRLDTETLDRTLTEVPPEDPTAAVMEGEEVTLPLPDGTFQRFHIVEVPILSPELAAQHPDVQTYSGYGMDDPRMTVRCTRTPLGFQAQIRTPKGTVYVDPLWRGDEEVHAVYWAHENGDDRAWECGVEDLGEAATHHVQVPGGNAITSGTQLRTYRLVLQLAGEYTVFFGGAAAAFAAATTTVNNVSGILENDVDVRLNLILMQAWADPTTDPFTSNNSALWCGETQAANDTLTGGGANYDIGHLFMAQGYSGNACCIGCVCTTGSEGGGWSARNPPTGATYTFLVAHEMGHQFGGRHTWNGTGCAASQWDSAAASEPGSGSTIMSYYGICGADNMPPGGNAGAANLYYHIDSVNRIVLNTQGGTSSTCPTVTATGNNPPSVSAGPDYTIPSLTPFVLGASGSDPDGDPLTWCWEQWNVPSPAPAALNAPDDGAIPLFRSRFPTSSPMRTIPDLADVVAGSFFPGTLGEQLPSTARTIIMNVTARDNRANGGGIDSDTMNLTSDAASGPFVVTFPNGGENLDGANPVIVTWNVAGTSGAPVNAANVNILLSLDGGFTYPITLAAGTPNDGSQSVNLPACTFATTCRVMVRDVATPHYFFDISDNDFTISDQTPPVVTCAVQRQILFPTRGALVNPNFTRSATDDCDPPGSITYQVTVRSDEAHGPAPYTPDVFNLGPTSYLLRSDRNITGNGRVYLFLVEAFDTAGNRGFECCTAVVPRFPTVSYITSALMQATNARTECLGNNGATPTTTPIQLDP